MSRTEEPDMRVAGPAPGAVPRLAELLRVARRPVFIAGRDARPTGTRNALIQLAAFSGSLLATSAAARDLFDGEPWSIDVSGGSSARLADDLIRTADLVVGWGMSHDARTLRHGAPLSAEATVVRIDQNADVFGDYAPVDVILVGDVRSIAEATVDALRSHPRTTLSWRTPELRRDLARRQLALAPQT
ncbi:hypothetical protein [Phytoactinopolyspora halotolerans]|uniref:Thiamine pyrophosphate enzyme central domain-containing protein n=1 Tax=Phytoactinopolyspora halotolerans TaxID=1981512 RepID=A0A6L9S252_9ACTN|nr:hypothetical protein [Phytoactinopolyspora halotolerans]NED99098.1 hypothetical protein [Phytoactinopolyspora halotolerans]